MISGRVRQRRSLHPLRSRGWSLNRSPRKSASPSRYDWIIVPMAPSRTRIRSRSRRERGWDVEGIAEGLPFEDYQTRRERPVHDTRRALAPGARPRRRRYRQVESDADRLRTGLRVDELRLDLDRAPR